MKLISLNGQEDSIRRFILALAVEPEGSIFEFDGKAVARIVPISPKTNGKPPAREEWTDAKNARRSELVDRKIDGSITPEEAEELADSRTSLTAMWTALRHCRSKPQESCITNCWRKQPQNHINDHSLHLS